MTTSSVMTHTSCPYCFSSMRIEEVIIEESIKHQLVCNKCGSRSPIKLTVEDCKREVEYVLFGT